MSRDPLILARIPQTLQARVEAEAARVGTSKSAVVRAALEAHLAPAPRATPARSRKRSVGAEMCAHRMHVGSFCAKCGGVVS